MERKGLDNAPNRTRIPLLFGAERREERGIAGVDTFLELTDTPPSYAGESGKWVRVKSNEQELEFASVPSSFGITYTVTLATMIVVLLVSATLTNILGEPNTQTLDIPVLTNILGNAVSMVLSHPTIVSFA